MSELDDATQAQREAAAPGQSTWLTANAGSGKTTVLTNRVARLLLAGTPPAQILCLTFTKAAAGEMQNRLFKSLAEWAMAEDADLRLRLAEIGETTLADGEALMRARRLFAQAIDTPGGLKIQTIHAFCAALLRQFPLEAGVSPSFVEIDEVSAGALQAEILRSMAAADSDASFALLFDHIAEGKLADVIKALVNNRHAFGAKPSSAEIRHWFDVTTNQTDEGLLASVITASRIDMITELREVLLRSESKSDPPLGARLPDLSSGREATLADLRALQGVFLTEKGTKRARVMTKESRDRLSEATLADLADLADDILTAHQTQLALDRVAETEALLTFATSFLKRYEKVKAQRGLLDFDDLISGARRLLCDHPSAQWVLWRLDARIDHILVDEAQDTSPAQWEIARALVAEFMAGEGARDQTRTVFVVGDPKQSIFGFQGADLAIFEQTRGALSQGFSQAQLSFGHRNLAHSFRSSPLILSLVDQVAQGSTGLGAATVKHLPVWEELPGRIDLFDPPPENEAAVKPEFGSMRPLSGRGDPLRESAEAWARRLLAMVHRDYVKDKGAGELVLVEPRHILVLVRKRNPFVRPFIAACKRLGLPVAGVDRMVLQEQVAVRDIIALLRFLDLPEDDLSLAEVLRSPLGGFGETDLFTLAHHRAEGQGLWSALRDFGPGQVLVLWLNDLLARTEILRPFDLISHILGAADGRRRLAARLGEECHDALDSLMDRALKYESTEIASLSGFLSWLDEDETEIKRPLAHADNVVRVMTVHGAKGLDAPIVVLPDCGTVRDNRTETLLDLGEGRLTLRPRSDDQAEVHREAEARRKEAEQAEQERLLYVALTRAKAWLMVGTVKPQKDEADSWYSRIAQAFQEVSLPDLRRISLEGGQRLEFGDWSAPITGVSSQPTESVLPDALVLPPLPPQARRTTFLAPSNLAETLGLASTLKSGDLAEQARLRGIFLHSLFITLPDLPPEDRHETAQRLAGDNPGFDVQAAIDEAMNCLALPLFAAPALVEVPVAADLPDLGGAAIYGAIDRIVIHQDHVLIVDYKSDRDVPTSPNSVPKSYLIQLAAYRAALAQVLPNTDIRCAILWTSQARLMPLENEIVRLPARPLSIS